MSQPVPKGWHSPQDGRNKHHLAKLPHSIAMYDIQYLCLLLNDVCEISRFWIPLCERDSRKAKPPLSGGDFACPVFLAGNFLRCYTLLPFGNRRFRTSRTFSIRRVFSIDWYGMSCLFAKSLIASTSDSGSRMEIVLLEGFNSGKKPISTFE